MSAAGALGAALTSIGQSRNEKRKEDLLERLEREKEERARDDQLAAEQRAEDRERRKVQRTEIRPDAGCAMKEYGVSSYGDTVYTKDANPLELDRIKREEEKEKASIEQTLAYTDASRASAEQNRLESRYIPQERADRHNVAEATVRNYDEPNRGPPKETPESENLLAQARAMIGKHIKVKTKEGVYAVKIATPEFVAEWLRQKGRPALADAIYKSDK